MDRTPEPIEREGPAARAEWLERLAADQELAHRVQREGFDGKTWYFLSTALVSYATQVMVAWIRKGEIFGRCRELGIRVRRPPDGGVSSLDAAMLAEETVANGIIRFQNEVLALSIWDPMRGASLKTFFIGMCLKQFPTTYTECIRKRQREVRQLRAETEFVRSNWSKRSDDDALEWIIEDLVPDALTREIVRMLAENYSHAEIAALLGVTAGSIESRLYRLRRRVREQYDQRRAA